MHTDVAVHDIHDKHDNLDLPGRARRRGDAPHATLSIWCRRVPLADPLALFSDDPACHFYTRIPTENLEVIGFGRAWSFETDGADRFEAAQAALQEALGTARTHGNEFGLTPRAWGGFSFHPGKQTGEWTGFASASWFIPAYQFIRRGDEAFEVFTTASPNESPQFPDHRAPGKLNTGDAASPAWQPDPAPSVRRGEWVSRSDAALHAVEDNQYKKIVLARSQTYRYEHGSTAGFLDSLRTHHPGPVFAMRNQDRWFVSATPEILLRAKNGEFATHAVAGTTQRGANSQEDNALATRLLLSAKDREEHAWVVESILEALIPLSVELSSPSTPLVMRLPKLQHLVSPITGRFQKDVHFLTAIKALHPTAAVGGYPRQQAVEWLLENEHLSRGWYASPIGWLDAAGDGSMWVGIRSGLLGATQSVLFAGAGLVPGSDSQAEWEETELKLNSFLTAIGALGADGAGA